MMTEILIPYMEDGAWTYMGSGTNQVLSEVVAGNGSLLRSVGMPKDSGGYDGVGTNQFGKDGVYQYLLRNELCVLSGGVWSYDSRAGVWHSAWNYYRAYSGAYVGLSLACYPV